MPFPKNFVWGAATSSYQIEGNVAADGRGLAVWDQFCAQPGRVQGGDTGAIACDHYRRYEGDVNLMRALGLQAYRFSVAWPRVLPNGRGAVSAAGLAFYDRLVDALLEAGVEPWLTLFHWDYPLALYREGGWLHADSPKWFADYTRVVVDRLSDRVTHWITINEPQCFIGLGHHTGVHAPGDTLSLPDVLRAAHHTLLAHGMAVQTIRSHAKLRPRVGWAPTSDVAIPASESAEDIGAAREAFWHVRADSVWNMAWWVEPTIHGRYPEQGLQAYGAAAPSFTGAEMATIAQPLDFVGVNFYHGYLCRRNAEGVVEKIPPQSSAPRAHNHWPVTPAALHWGPRFTHERCQRPIAITENGMACHDAVTPDGAAHDPQRVDYLTSYLGQLRRAIDEGVPVEAYFAWSFLDNFEWAEGYRYRFGLVHVDYATQRRTPKDSALWYREFIRVNGEPGRNDAIVRELAAK